MPKITPVQQRINRLKQLKTDTILSSINGDYKSFKKAAKEFAIEAVQDFEAAKAAQAPIYHRISLFSKTGLRIAKVWLLNKFRIKTPEEKMLKKLMKEDAIKEKLFSDFRRLR